MRTNVAIAAMGLLALAWGTTGCSNSAPRPAEKAASNDTAHDHAGHDHAETANTDIVAAFAKLPAEDRGLAERQKICPVSGELLGAMGAPLKIDVAGQAVFICCEGCKEELLAKPDEYLAKLKK